MFSKFIGNNLVISCGPATSLKMNPFTGRCSNFQYILTVYHRFLYWFFRLFVSLLLALLCFYFSFYQSLPSLDEELQLSFDFSLVFCVFPFARFFDGSFDKTVSQHCDMQMSVARIANCSLSIPDQFVSSIYTRLVLFCSMS